MVHGRIELSNMGRAVGMIFLSIAVTLTLEVHNLVNHMLFIADMVDKEMHAMQTVITSEKPLLCRRRITGFHSLAEMVSIL